MESATGSAESMREATAPYKQGYGTMIPGATSRCPRVSTLPISGTTTLRLMQRIETAVC